MDQSYEGAELVARQHLPADEAESLIRGGEGSPRRWQIVNVWRPIRTIRKDPLAVADGGSIEEEDLVAASVVFDNGAGVRKLKSQTWTVKPGKEGRHRWFFKRAQKPDEVLLIKCFDSWQREGLVRRSPHCAFIDPEAEEEASRESVEVRALLFYD